MMFRLILIFSFLLFVQKSDRIAFSDIKKIYTKNSKVNFSIKNNNSQTTIYNVGLEILINNEWHETSSDITNLNSKATRLFKTKSNLSQSFTLDLKNTFFKGNRGKFKYRFFVSLRNSDYSIKENSKITSDAFVIE